MFGNYFLAITWAPNQFPYGISCDYIFDVTVMVRSAHDRASSFILNKYQYKNTVSISFGI